MLASSSGAPIAEQLGDLPVDASRSPRPQTSRGSMRGQVGDRLRRTGRSRRARPAAAGAGSAASGRPGPAAGGTRDTAGPGFSPATRLSSAAIASHSRRQVEHRAGDRVGPDGVLRGGRHLLLQPERVRDAGPVDHLVDRLGGDDLPGQRVRGDRLLARPASRPASAAGSTRAAGRRRPDRPAGRRPAWPPTARP